MIELSHQVHMPHASFNPAKLIDRYTPILQLQHNWQHLVLTIANAVIKQSTCNLSPEVEITLLTRKQKIEPVYNQELIQRLQDGDYITNERPMLEKYYGNHILFVAALTICSLSTISKSPPRSPSDRWLHHFSQLRSRCLHSLGLLQFSDSTI